ncbi:MAG: glycosyltransferase family A protein [Cyclobacteriaceae bacterium]|nr:glycosyltransferase family A protein [Cyclobacteriaceae bacterium]
MTNNPLFSVVIPTYNRAGFIRKAIESVLAQTYQDFEIVVVDDGSTDDTETVVKSIANTKIHYHKKVNAERAAARNFGAKISNGQYVNFLDSDDVVYPQHLQVANEFIAQHKGLAIFHLGYDIKDEHNRLIRSTTNIQSINQQILSGNILSCNGVFIEKEIIMVNQFNEDRALSSLEDWELWIRISARYPFLNDNTITSSVIQHDERSVMSVDTSKLKLKIDQFIHYVLQDELNKKYFGSNLNKAVASAWTYAALHLAIANESKKEVLYYLLKGIKRYPSEVLKKRFLVIIKKLIGF